jgi:hypothetical protein
MLAKCSSCTSLRAWTVRSACGLDTCRCFIPCPDFRCDRLVYLHCIWYSNALRRSNSFWRAHRWHAGNCSTGTLVVLDGRSQATCAQRSIFVLYSVAVLSCFPVPPWSDPLQHVQMKASKTKAKTWSLTPSVWGILEFVCALGKGKWAGCAAACMDWRVPAWQGTWIGCHAFTASQLETACKAVDAGYQGAACRRTLRKRARGDQGATARQPQSG